MAGTLVISTLSDGTNSTSSTNCIQGSAKAWANANPPSNSIRASYNVSSVTKNSTGDFTFTFTNAMSDTNYTVFVGGGNGGGNAPMNTATMSQTTTQFRVDTCGLNQAANVNVDATVVFVAVFR